MEPFWDPYLDAAGTLVHGQALEPRTKARAPSIYAITAYATPETRVNTTTAACVWQVWYAVTYDKGLIMVSLQRQWGETTVATSLHTNTKIAIHIIKNNQDNPFVHRIVQTCLCNDATTAEKQVQCQILAHATALRNKAVEKEID